MGSGGVNRGLYDFTLNKWMIYADASNIYVNGNAETATTLSSTLVVGKGGTGTTTAPTQGGIIYGASASAYGCTAAGTSGYILKSNGTGAPTWLAQSSIAAGSATKDGSGNTITSYYLPKANVNGTANYVPKFTAANTIGNSRITDDGTTITLNSSTLIKATNSNYCDGLRICPATNNGWGIIYFSALSTSTSGTHDGGWLVGRMGANAGAGVINDFTIEHNSSSAKGLTIHKADASMTLYGSKFNLANKAVSFVYNSTDKCIEFTFA
jgi:hypothetical protein